VSFGSRPTSSPPFRPRPSGRADERSAFAVGSRALVTTTAPGTTQVQLLDEDGLPTSLHLNADVGVVITAWRPRRMATPRYRVRSTDGVEGWIDATNLRRLPPPPPPAPSIPSAIAPKVAPKVASKTASKTAAARAPARKPAPPAPPASRPPAKVAAKIAPKPAPKPAPKAAAPKRPVKPTKPAKAAAKVAPKTAKPAAKKKPVPARKRAR
jgi:hypothetical protein